jgi:tRNA pseudouridine55 synthase
MNGVMVVNKPAGMTSHDVVQRARKMLGERSIGHLGTLDPMATGVLPLLIGRMTRLAQFYLGAEKTYEGEIRFGFATDTYDADGDPAGEPRPISFDRKALEQAAARFRGPIQQTPPPFSAKKIAGVPAYKLARKKKEVELEPVMVEVKEFEILSFEGERAKFKARVASGTYLRSIAHELGQALGCGAHLASLCRTSVGEFTLAEARTLEEAQKAVDALGLRDIQCPITDIMYSNEGAALFLHPRRLLPQFPAVTAPPDAQERILHGNAVNLSEMSAAPLVKVFASQTELIAIARRVAGTLFQPKIVLIS